MADNIGDVYVDVGADTSTLESKLKAKLDEITKRVQAKIKAAIDTSVAGADLDAWIKKSSAKHISNGVEVTDESFVKNTAKIDSWIKLMSLKSIKIGVSSGSSALSSGPGKSVLSSLSGLTGISSVTGEFQKFSGTFQSFLSNLPAVGQMALKIGSLGSLALTGFGSLASTFNTLTPAVAGFAAVGVAIPGILASMGASAVVLISAFKNAPPAITASLNAYKGMEKEIATDFWKQAETQVQGFFTGMKSQATAGFAEISTGLGAFVGSLAKSLNADLGGGVLKGMFDNMEAGFKDLLPAAEPFAEILANLGTYGTSLLPGISKWITQIATEFDGWLGTAMQTGALTNDLKGLQSVLSLVWNGLVAVVNIAKGLGDAAQNAGIGNFISPLTTIANIVNSPVFQHALTTLFTGAAGGASALLAALTPIGSLISTLAPILSGFLQGAGSTIGALLTSLANALAGPGFQKGLSTFFAGVLGLVQPLIPLMPVFAEKLALIGTLGGKLLAAIGPVLAQMLETLVPAFGKVIAVVIPLAQTLLPVLGTVIKVLGPIISDVIKAATPFINLIVALLPSIDAIVKAVGAGLQPVFAALQPFFKQIASYAAVLGQAFAALTPLITPLMTIIGFLVKIALQPLTIAFSILQPILQPLIPIITILAQVIGALLTTIIDLMEGKFSDIPKVWSGVWDSISSYWNGTVMPFFQGIGDWFAGIWDGLVKAAQHGGQQIMDFFSGFAKWISDLWNGLWNGAENTFNNVMDSIARFGISVDNSILSGLQGFINGAIDAVNGLTSGINNVTKLVGIPAIGKIPHVALPRLADGATILPRSGGTAAILGEGGKAESVVDTGMMNKLLNVILNTFPAAVAGLKNTTSTTNNQSSTVSQTTHNWDVDLSSDNDDPKATAQEFVNRLAKKVKFG